VKYLCQLHLKYTSYRRKTNQNYRSFKLNKNPSRIYGYQTRGWTDTTYKFCTNSYGFFFY